MKFNTAVRVKKRKSIRQEIQRNVYFITNFIYLISQMKIPSTSQQAIPFFH